MRRPANTIARPAALALALLVASASVATASSTRSLASSASPPSGQPAPTRLVGLYAARFSTAGEQTSGTWHLRIGPGHHVKVWNTDDPIAHSPSFEAGPVSFRGNRMVFARFTAEGVCNVSATYRWRYRNGLLRFRLIGRDECRARVITFTPHPWRRSS